MDYYYYSETERNKGTLKVADDERDGERNNVISFTKSIQLQLIIETIIFPLAVDHTVNKSLHVSREPPQYHKREGQRERARNYCYAKADARYFKTAEWNELVLLLRYIWNAKKGREVMSIILEGRSVAHALSPNVI